MFREMLKDGKILRGIKVLLGTYVLSGVMLMVLAFVWYRWNIGEKQIALGVITIYVISTFWGGFVIGKYNKIKKYLWGLGIGLVYYVLLMIITLVMKQGLSDQHVVSTMILCLSSGMLGGMIS